MNDHERTTQAEIEYAVGCVRLRLSAPGRPATLRRADGTHFKTVNDNTINVFTALVRKAGSIVSNDELIMAGWGKRKVNTPQGTESLRHAVQELRLLLGDDADAIKTSRGVGYVLIAPTAEVAAIEQSPSSTATNAYNKWTSPNAFHGRIGELGRIDSLVTGGAGLVSLVGLGGVGKTRLMQEFLRTHERGVLEISGESVVNGADLATTIARALGIALDDTAGFRDSLAQVGRALAHRGYSIVAIDNLDSAAPPALEGLQLLSRRVMLLVTSRVTWRLPEERTVTVVPLQSKVAKDLLVSRLEERGQIVSEDPDPLLTALEGLPLAIELAVPWLVDGIPPHELADEINRRRFDILGLGGPTVIPRHRSLWATIEYTWCRLSHFWRRSWCEFALFATPASLAAISQILTRHEGHSIAEMVAYLRDHSLIQPQHGSTYVMLDSLREFASTQAEKDEPDQATARQRHADFFVGSAKAAIALLNGVRQREGMAGLRAILPELKSIHENSTDASMKLSAGHALLQVLKRDGPRSALDRLLDDLKQLEVAAAVSRPVDAQAHLYLASNLVTSRIHAPDLLSFVEKHGLESNQALTLFHRAFNCSATLEESFAYATTLREGGHRLEADAIHARARAVWAFVPFDQSRPEPSLYVLATLDHAIIGAKHPYDGKCPCGCVSMPHHILKEMDTRSIDNVLLRLRCLEGALERQESHWGGVPSPQQWDLISALTEEAKRTGDSWSTLRAHFGHASLLARVGRVAEGVALGLITLEGTSAASNRERGFAHRRIGKLLLACRPIDWEAVQGHSSAAIPLLRTSESGVGAAITAGCAAAARGNADAALDYLRQAETILTHMRPTCPHRFRLHNILCWMQIASCKRPSIEPRDFVEMRRDVLSKVCAQCMPAREKSVLSSEAVDDAIAAITGSRKDPRTSGLRRRAHRTLMAPHGTLHERDIYLAAIICGLSGSKKHS